MPCQLVTTVLLQGFTFFPFNLLKKGGGKFFAHVEPNPKNFCRTVSDKTSFLAVEHFFVAFVVSIRLYFFLCTNQKCTLKKQLNGNTEDPKNANVQNA